MTSAIRPVQQCGQLVENFDVPGAASHVTAATVVLASASEPEHCDVRGYVEPAVNDGHVGAVPAVDGAWANSQPPRNDWFRFRRLLLNVDLRWLTGVQLWRVVGTVFLPRCARHELPASFAIPAGIGDVLVGLTAPSVHRGACGIAPTQGSPAMSPRRQRTQWPTGPTQAWSRISM